MDTRVARGPLWLVVLGLAVAYCAAARLGLSLAALPDYKLTAVWPPSGLALAALLLFGRRAWPGVWVGAFVANLGDAVAANRDGSFTAHLISSAAIATGAMAQALWGAALTRRSVAPSALSSTRDAFRFVAVAAVMCLISATVAAGALGATGLAPWAAVPTVWWTWWIGDTVGVLVVAPVLLTWGGPRATGGRRPSGGEAVTLFVLLFVACGLVFGGWWHPVIRSAPLAYLSLPFLVWAAVRFGPRGATLAVAVVTVFAVGGTVGGTGPFAHGDVYRSLLLLDVFLTVVVVTSLILCAGLRERDQIEIALRASEAKFRQLAEALPQIVWTTGPDGTIEYLNRRWTEYTGLTSATPDELARVVHADDLAGLAAAAAAATRAGGVLQHEFRLRPADGGAHRWFLARSVPLTGPGGDPAGLLGTSTDIDDLKRAQAESARQRAELQLILDTVPALISFKDRNHRLVRVNNELVRLMGLPYESIVGRTDSELGSPHAADYRLREEQVMQEGVPRTVIEPLHTFAGTRWLQTTKLPHRDAEGRVTGILGLSVDITEQKQAEDEVRRLNAELERRVAERTAVAEARATELQSAVEALREQKQLLETILDSLGEAVLVAGRDGRVLLQNRAFRRLHATPAEHVTSSDLPRLHGVHLPGGTLCPVDQLPIARAVRGEACDDVELLIVDAARPNGVPISVTGRPILGPNGVEGGVIAIRDVSAARRSEAALRASEERYALAVRGSQDGIWDWDLRTGTVYYSPRWKQMLGYADHEVVPRVEEWERLVHPDDLPAARAALTAYFGRTAGSYGLELRMLHRDGTYRWIYTRGVAQFGPDGRPERMGGSHTDVTARHTADAAIRRAAEELAATEALLRQFIKHAPAAIAMLDTEMRYVQASDRWVSDYRLLGRDLIGRSYYEVFPDAPDRWKQVHRRVLAGTVEACAEDPFRRADGGTEWLQWECRPWRAAGGEIGGLIMFTQVITDRIRAAESLRESEERFRGAFDHAAVGMALVSPEGRWLKVNQSVCRMLGYAADELLRTDFQTITHPDDLNADLALVGQVLSGALATYQMEKRYFHKDGHVLFVLLAVSLVRDPRGAPLYFVSQMEDITERRRAEHALRVSEERFRVLFEHSSDAHLIFDEGDGILDCNRAAVELLRYPDKSAVLALHPAVLSPEFQPDGRRSLEKCVEMDATARRDGYHRFDWLHRRADGEAFPCEVTLTPVALEGRTVLLTVWHDLTERKRAELALRASEERYRTVVQSLVEGVVVLDRGGTIAACNDRAPEILGLTRDQLVGRTPLDPRWCAVREDGSPFPGADHPSMAVLRTGVAQSNTVMGVRTPGGEVRWISVNAAPVPGLDGAGAAVVCSFHDVTAVRGANDRLRASVREKEAMLKEIHHRVKNNLQIISTLLDLQSDGLTDPAALAAFRESRGRVRSMSLIHERLYRSENLASVEFGAYLRGLADDLFRAYRADDEAIKLEVSVLAPPLPLDVAIPCGLLVNELISNCLKYAFAGRESGIISVSLEHTGAETFVLTVADDGVGLPVGFDLRRPTSFGLQLANTLAEQLGGALATGTGPGARFTVQFSARG